MRLFAIACCRRTWERITDPRCQAAVDFAERHVEVGIVRRRGRPAVAKAAREAAEEAEEARRDSQDCSVQVARLIDVNAFHAASATVEGVAWIAAYLASSLAANAVAWDLLRDKHRGPVPWDHAAKEAELRQQIPLIRDIFANPFHPLPPVSTLVLAWGDGAVPKLAQSIYDEAAFDRLPILADALEEAGCSEEALLAHCRGAGGHVRGCWAVDLLLGKQ
jgi:hypothetical protein